MAGILPRTLKFVCAEVASFVRATTTSISASFCHAVEVIHAAPVESLVGLTASALIVFSSYKLIQHFVRQYNLTWWQCYKPFYASFTNLRNKLECLSMASILA
jgi:hypothetical protein